MKLATAFLFGLLMAAPVASAQIKSAILLAALNSPGQTIVTEREASRDHTEKMLAYFGAQIASAPEGESGRRISLKGRPELAPVPIAVPADPSSAAFPLVAALIVPACSTRLLSRDKVNFDWADFLSLASGSRFATTREAKLHQAIRLMRFVKLGVQ